MLLSRRRSTGGNNGHRGSGVDLETRGLQTACWDGSQPEDHIQECTSDTPAINILNYCQGSLLAVGILVGKMDLESVIDEFALEVLGGR